MAEELDGSNGGVVGGHRQECRKHRGRRHLSLYAATSASFTIPTSVRELESLSPLSKSERSPRRWILEILVEDRSYIEGLGRAGRRSTPSPHPLLRAI